MCWRVAIDPGTNGALLTLTSKGFPICYLRFAFPHFLFPYIKDLQRREAEHSLTFLGFIVMQNKLKPQTSGVIKVLAGASIRSVMVTGTVLFVIEYIFLNKFNIFVAGDNPLTAVCIAKECNLVPAGMHVFLADAVKGFFCLFCFFSSSPPCPQCGYANH